MRTRTYLWIFAAAVIVSVAVWILQDRSPLDADPSRLPATKHKAVVIDPVQTTTTAVVIARLKEKDRSRLEAEGERLVEDARNALEAGDKQGFEKVIIEIIHRYSGDPNPLILKFADVLEHVDPHLRIRMAGYFLLTNLKADEAVQVLRDIVRTDEPMMYGPERNELLNEEFPPSDYRFRAADILALYRIEKAKDDVWALYQKTNSKELIKPLRRLNDTRMIEKLKESALKKSGTIENMKLIGEFRMEEALPELRKRYEDKNLSDDLRFRTLYPLWRITGEEKYFDEFAASFHSTVPVPYLAVGGERERDYIVKMLETEGSDTLYKAAMALHLRYQYDKPLIDMLIGYFNNIQTSNWKDGVLARRLVGSIDDPELTRVAEEYERKYQNEFHDRYAVYRKNWRYPEWEESLFMD
jgi:HEAT repeat protein